MRIYLAPMEGLLDFLLRGILTEIGGIDVCVSEFIRINNTLLPDHRFFSVVPELYNNCKTEIGVPVKVQILGSDPICMAENAAKIASLGAYGIDLNFGCPAPTVNRNRGGAALLKEPDLMFSIVESVRRSVPKNIPVSSKMRLGFDSKELALVCAEALASAGSEEIVVHARTKTDGYKPPAYWDWIGKIRNHVKVPIIANGEIWDAESATRCKEISGCDDIMIGRGAVASPGLALLIRGTNFNHLPWNQIVDLLEKYYFRMKDTTKIQNVSGRIKQWLHYLSRQYPEADFLFGSVKRLSDPNEIITTLKTIPIESQKLTIPV